MGVWSLHNLIRFLHKHFGAILGMEKKLFLPEQAAEGSLVFKESPTNMNIGGNDARGARPVVNEAVMLCEIKK